MNAYVVSEVFIECFVFFSFDFECLQTVYVPSFL